MSNAATQGEPVLIVDNDQAIRETLCHVLVDEGYSVVEAADGKQALDILSQTSSPRRALRLATPNHCVQPAEFSWGVTVSIVRYLTRPGPSVG